VGSIRILYDRAARRGHDRVHDGAGQFGQHREDVVHLPVEAAGPDLLPDGSVDQPRRQFQALPIAADAALEQRRDAELSGDGPDVDVLALEAERGGARDDPESRYASEKYSCSGSPVRFSKGSTAIAEFEVPRGSRRARAVGSASVCGTGPACGHEITL
jgi:hypothetical protein